MESFQLNVSFLSTVFMTGLLGGLHCVGMCGGILASMATSEAGQRRARLAALHLGRIASYGTLGAVMGAAGSVIGLLDRLMPLQVVLYLLANAVLLVVGAYLLGWTTPLQGAEALGASLWRHVAPLTRRWIPVRTPSQGLMVGLLWGLMPCGLVYGALAMALISGGPGKGGLLMVVFGLGTLPNLLAAGAILRQGLKTSLRRIWRLLSGGLIVAFGVYGLAHAVGLEQHLRRGLYCLTSY